MPLSSTTPAASESPVIPPPLWASRRRLPLPAENVFVGIRAGTEWLEGGYVRRPMTEATLISDNVVLEGGWSSDSSFDAEPDPETASLPATPVGEATATEQRADGTLKGFLLTFRDRYLEADFQIARQKELGRSLTIVRASHVALVMLWCCCHVANMKFSRLHTVSEVTFDFLIKSLALVPTLVVLCWTFARSFASKYDAVVGSCTFAYIILQTVVDYRLVSCTTPYAYGCCSLYESSRRKQENV